MLNPFILSVLSAIKALFKHILFINPQRTKQKKFSLVWCVNNIESTELKT